MTALEQLKAAQPSWKDLPPLPTRLVPAEGISGIGADFPQSTIEETNPIDLPEPALPPEPELGGGEEASHPWKITLDGTSVKVAPGFILGKKMTFANTGTVTPDGPDTCLVIPIGYHENEDLLIPVTETGYIVATATRSGSGGAIYSDCTSDPDSSVFVEDLDQINGTLLDEEIIPYFSTALPDDSSNPNEYVRVILGKVTVDGDTYSIKQYVTHNPEVFLPVTMVAYTPPP